MDKNFHISNRKKLYEAMENSSILLLFSGNSAHRTADAYHTFVANRKFAYLSGLGQVECENFVLKSLFFDLICDILK